FSSTTPASRPGMPGGSAKRAAICGGRPWSRLVTSCSPASSIRTLRLQSRYRKTRSLQEVKRCEFFCTVDEGGNTMKGHKWFAALFDAMGRLDGSEKFLAQHRPHIAGEAEGTVLEIGAGTGANFPYFKQAAKVIATEPDP